MKRKTQEEKDLEHFEKMKDYITRELLSGRDISAIQGSINRRGDWWKNKLETYREELEDEKAYNLAIISGYPTF